MAGAIRQSCQSTDVSDLRRSCTVDWRLFCFLLGQGETTCAKNSSSSAMAWRPGACWSICSRPRRAAYDVTIFNAEPRVNYNRLMLSPVLSGEKTYRTDHHPWRRLVRQHGVTLHKAAPVTTIDRAARAGHLRQRDCRRDYDKLVIATGSTPFIIPPFPATNLAGVVTYRDLDDVDKMLAVGPRRPGRRHRRRPARPRGRRRPQDAGHGCHRAASRRR